MNPDIIEAIFPVKSEWLTLDLESDQTISALTTTLDLRLVCWEWDDQAKARTVWGIYTQTTQLLPRGYASAEGLSCVENYLLALGLTLEQVFRRYDMAVVPEANGRINIWDAVQALRLGFGKNHPLLLAKAQTVEDFVKALETKGRLGRWL